MSVDRRILKAGRHMVVDLDTGSVEIIHKLSLLERRKRKERFVVANLELCARCWEKGHWHKDATKTVDGIKLVKKARKALKISPKTGSGDLYVLIMHQFRRSNKAKPTNGCDCGWCRSNR